MAAYRFLLKNKTSQQLKNKDTMTSQIKLLKQILEDEMSFTSFTPNNTLNGKFGTLQSAAEIIACLAPTYFSMQESDVVSVLLNSDRVEKQKLADGTWKFRTLMPKSCAQRHHLKACLCECCLE
jgi:hypothetical protein